MSRIHTYGPTCRRRRRLNSSDEDGMPHLNAQFFYSSPLSIDDPLSAVPLPQGSDSISTRHPPRPFSAYDNNALEEAWSGLSSVKNKKNQKDRHAVQAIGKAFTVTKPEGRKEETSCSVRLGAASKRTSSLHSVDAEPAAAALSPGPTVKPLELAQRRENSIQTTSPSCGASSIPGPSSNSRLKRISTSHEDPPACFAELERQKNDSQKSYGNKRHCCEGRTNSDQPISTYGCVDNNQVSTSDVKKFPDNELVAEQVGAVGDAGTTGNPFLKYSTPAGGPPLLEMVQDAGSPSGNLEGGYFDGATKTGEDGSDESDVVRALGCKTSKKKGKQAEVPVGISRLHFVSLPALRLTPIYWSPVHDIAAVARGTWFYKDTMLPVEPAVANHLEYGYRELRPWSQTWSDELNSAIEVGAAGEEKIVYRLWPKEGDKSDTRNTVKHASINASDPYCAATCFRGEVAAEGSLEPQDQNSSETRTVTKKYPNAQVIFKDSRTAFILKPTLHPSAYYGRKPLQKIMRGTTVGICVIRGFDWKAWEKLHPSKMTNIIKKAEANAPVAVDTDTGKGELCLACRSQEERPPVTDLVLVIHGIGQKLSERVESFHFTHAINEFRRSVNVEFSDEGVQRVLRPEFGGIMVLPVNWRSNLSFEDGGPLKEGDKVRASPDFTLKDITPDTIPAVRNLISDVMLDIPFYMSQHKPKMIQAVISEANRVYGLWCKNNADFHKRGRVHLIAHSLGSAMAVEVLSKQPTSIGRFDMQSKKLNTKHFDFDTKNLFFVGSPAAFFLLLDKGKLLPRKNRRKPGIETGADQDREITGDAGTFGCLAVDNVYNVIASNDPISYRLNAAVDRQYAASLKDARVPSATTGFFESISHVMKSITPGVSPPSDLAVGQVAKPSGPTRLPSQLEMEIHDFTREEIAENKFYLLNDNGQVDWFLSSGGGPLEIQYINMLGAHSSYWGSLDFVRMVVTEVGRRPGRDYTLPNMRAVKSTFKP